MADVQNYRRNLALSLGLLPLANAIGHLPAAIGGAWVAVGKPITDLPVLLLLFSVHMLVDSLSTCPEVKKPVAGNIRLTIQQVVINIKICHENLGHLPNYGSRGLPLSLQSRSGRRISAALGPQYKSFVF
jgi:hypothetical protein